MRITLTAAALCLLAALAFGTDVRVAEFEYASSIDNTRPLFARVTFPHSATNCRLLVLLHGYAGNREDTAFTARRAAEKGFFCLSPDTRGWGGAAGRNDDGGLEIMDIRDGILEARRRFPRISDEATSIIGYSHGASQALLAVVRMPFEFNAALAFFGFTDYAEFMRLNTNQLPHFAWAIGGMPADVPQKYRARSANAAASNAVFTAIFTAHDETESICPPQIADVFLETVRRAGNENVHKHVSRAGDANRWIHGPNLNGHLSAMEDVFMRQAARLPTPEMPLSGELAVPGFLITPRFTLILGKGDDASATVSYEFDGDTAAIQLQPTCADPEARGILRLPAGVFSTGHVVRIDNGEGVEYATACNLEIKLNSRIEILAKP